MDRRDLRKRIKDVDRDEKSLHATKFYIPGPGCFIHMRRMLSDDC